MFPYVILMFPYQLRDSHYRAHLVCTWKYYRSQHPPLLASTQCLANTIFSGSCRELWQGVACQWVGWVIHALALWSATDCVLWLSDLCPGYVLRGGDICLGHNSLVLDFFFLLCWGDLYFIYWFVIFAQLPVRKTGKRTLLGNSFLLLLASHCLKPSQILHSSCS